MPTFKPIRVKTSCGLIEHNKILTSSSYSNNVLQVYNILYNGNQTTVLVSARHVGLSVHIVYYKNLLTI